jgi:CRP-like cAMP-binding protein
VVGYCVSKHSAPAAFASAELGPIAAAAGTQAVGRRLSESTSLPHSEFSVLKALRKRKEHDTEAVLADDGMTAAGPPRFLLSGWACRQSIMADGRRQIFCFLIPGNIVVTSSKSLSLASVVAVTPGVTAQVLLSEDTHSSGAQSADYSALIDAAERETQRLLHDHIMRLGCMDGLERMAHLLLELHRRLSQVGLSNGQSFPMPLRQDALGDALGMSAVHVNRTLQKLRNNMLINYSGREVTIVDDGRLSDIAHGAVVAA